MIYVNNYQIIPSKFGDGTLKCPVVPDSLLSEQSNTIKWLYDNDDELFALYCIAKDMRSKIDNSAPISLIMPYVPHARQDRCVSDRLFTLKYFAEILNSLNFDRVYTLDVHSPVSKQLIHNISNSYGVCDNYLEGTVMYPDAGAANKYKLSNQNKDNSVIIGNKHRNSEGRIDSYELLNWSENIKSVTIRDDICSYGGTFVAAAKELRARGVKHIRLVVSHCENNILKGEVLNYIDEVYTTDSIFTETHPKIHIIEHFRDNQREKEVQ